MLNHENLFCPRKALKARKNAKEPKKTFCPFAFMLLFRAFRVFRGPIAFIAYVLVPTLKYSLSTEGTEVTEKIKWTKNNAFYISVFSVDRFTKQSSQRLLLDNSQS